MENRLIPNRLRCCCRQLQNAVRACFSHIARHTFAVMALNRGVTIHMISRLLGHSSIITTEKVYAEFLPDTITEEVKTKLSFGYMPSSF
nr:tyrosine-type recombinase/integrase [Alistipes sp. CAG:268]